LPWLDVIGPVVPKQSLPEGPSESILGYGYQSHHALLAYRQHHILLGMHHPFYLAYPLPSNKNSSKAYQSFWLTILED
jgi:hypothetical protein